MMISSHVSDKEKWVYRRVLLDNESQTDIYLEHREKSIGYRVEIRCRTALREIEVASEKLHSQQSKYKNK